MSREDYLQEFSAVDHSGFAIDKGVPLPPRVRGQGNKGHQELFPFGSMRVGDSFFVPAWRVLPSIVLSAAWEYHLKRPHYRFATRTYHNPNGVRVWRVSKGVS